MAPTLAVMMMTQLKVGQNTKITRLASIATLKCTLCFWLDIRYDGVYLLCWYSSEDQLLLTSTEWEEIGV